MGQTSIPVSFEFFPPRNGEQELVLQSTWQKLSRLNPRYLTVTFGAGGTAQEVTHQTVTRLIRTSGVPVAPHISCMARDRSLLVTLLEQYRQMGVERLVVLRGDMPEEPDMEPVFRHADELVTFIHQEFPSKFLIEVACYPELHPESPSMDAEIRYFRQKVDAGAEGAITQYFFDDVAYFEFVDGCHAAGIDIPITPGIMPITNYPQLVRFSARCGAKIPAAMAAKMERFGDDGASVRAYGLDLVSSLCERLLAGGAPGLHFYTLNRANATMLLWQRLHQGVKLGYSSL